MARDPHPEGGTMTDTRALDWLLAEKRGSHNLDGTPFECCDCPFGTPEMRHHNEPNPSDPGEGHYDCELLGRFGADAVWGEEPPCAPQDWTARARDELARLSVARPEEDTQ